MMGVIIQISDARRIGVSLLVPDADKAATIMRALKGAMMVASDKRYQDPPLLVLSSEVTVDLLQLKRGTVFGLEAENGEVTIVRETKPANRSHKALPERPALPDRSSREPKASPPPKDTKAIRDKGLARLRDFRNQLALQLPGDNS